MTTYKSAVVSADDQRRQAAFRNAPLAIKYAYYVLGDTSSMRRWVDSYCGPPSFGSFDANGSPVEAE